MVLAWHFRLEWGKSISATGFQRQVALANHDGFGYIAALLPDGGDRKEARPTSRLSVNSDVLPPALGWRTRVSAESYLRGASRCSPFFFRPAYERLADCPVTGYCHNPDAKEYSDAS
jgi:hypothetical protein